jgi:predicted Zn-dependent peptidase
MMSNIGAKGTNAFTSFEETAYINDIPSNQIDRWLTIEAERFRNPQMRLFHTELEAVYEEKNIGLDEDDTKVFETLFASLFKNHNYGQQTTIGTIEHLKNPSITEIRKYFSANYVPNNMVVIMVGDFNPDEVIAKVDAHFAYMQSKPVTPYTFKPEPAITAPIEKTILGPDAEYVQMAYRFPGANTRDALLLDLMSSLLSNGSAGLMDLNLVLKQKVLEASAGSYALKDYSVLFVQGKAKEGQSLEEVKNLMVDQITKLKKGEFDENLMKAVLNNYKRDNIRKYEKNTGRAFTLLDDFVSNVDWANDLGKVDMMSKLTKKDIMDFANKYMQNNYVCIYKKVGEDKNVEKVEKPVITPFNPNRDDQSAFLKSIVEMKAPPITPVFLNFDKDVQQRELKKAPVYCVANHDNQLFNLYYVLDMGKNNDKKLPIAVEYLQYLGTTAKTAEQVNSEFYQLACDFSVNAGNDQVYVSLSGLQENFDPAVKLLEDLMKNAKPDNEALSNMINDMIKKRSDAKLNKDVISREALMNYAIYGPKNPYNDVLSNDDLKAIKAADLTDMLHSLTAYEHKVLYYGPLKADDLVAQMTVLHPVAAALKAYPTPVAYPFHNATANEVFFVHYDNMKQAQITWTRKAADFDPEICPTANLFNEYFGNGMSAIVFQTLRESKALAYSTYSTFSFPGKKEHPFTSFSFIGTQADKFNEAVAGMNSLLDTLPKSDKLFETAVISVKNNISTSRIVKERILFSFLTAQKRGIAYDLREKMYNRVDQLSFNDINNFHKQYYSFKPYTYSILADKNKVKTEDMQKLGNFKVLSLEEIFGY